MKNIQLRFLILLFSYLMFSFAGLYAQQAPRKGTLSGRVTYTDGTPADMVTIFIKSINKHTYTNEQGIFKIEDLSIGKNYEIEVKTFGNESVKTKVHFTKKHQQITIRLKNNEGISLSEVAVSGSSKGKRAKEQGYAMNVIDTKEALLQNIQTTELLGRSAGIKIRQSAGMGSDISFNLNGLSGNSVRIFIDGIPIRNYGRSFSLSSIPPSMIERIEVYKGVLPSELSEDALGGGINVVLKKEMNNSLTTSYSYGSFNTHQWDLNATYRDKKSGFTANLSSFYNYTDNNYKVWGDNVYITDNTTGSISYIKAKRFHDRYYSSGIKSNFGFTRKKWADEFLLGFMFSETDKDIQTGATMEVVYGNRTTKYNSGMGSLQYKKNDLFLKGLDVSAFTTYSKTNRQVIDTIADMYNWTGQIAKAFNGIDNAKWSKGGGEAGRATLANNNEQNIANRSNIHYHINEQHNVGVSYFLNHFTREIDDSLESKEARDAMDKRRYNKQIASFNYDGNFFDKKLKVSLFYKKYQQNVRLTEYTIKRVPMGYEVKTTKHDRKMEDDGYGATVSYAVTPKIMISASAERAIRLPSITEILGNTSENIDPNTSLRPENSRNFNLGFNIGNFIFGKNELGGEANFFVRDIRDLIQRGVPRNTSDFYQFENLGKVLSKGVDAELRYNWNKKFFVNVVASYFDARFNLQYDEYGIEYFYYKSRLRNAPYFTGNFNAEYVFTNLIQKKARLAMNYNFNYTHEFFRDWEGLGSANKIIIPAQPLHDVGITYTFPNQKWTLAFNAKNIFDTQVFDNYALQKPGRSIFGKLTFSVF
ncbi:TonB-dependent receptor [Capnocytophaga cynodegmi]|uniref:TonB-dependent receptor n=1 Tax=Capnocytophaga cynodegmi TaxID=28189 RepID=A0A0B7HW81_9FLAO|nr:TonB-dependent receptor [Capnocytophaga cynodegmi]CEN34274.1 TonB-dependent receptor [Capnocytophaga cynodegmi]CEN41753.1 TonB-dependent receptor [Capnocytophaga cynodegmi]